MTTSEFGDRDDPHAQARSARNAPLLLHSLTLFSEVIGRIFAAARPATVVEVGVESGGASSIYLDHGANEVYCIEPTPTEQMRTTLAQNANLHLVEGFSPEVLGDLPLGDVYILDGDHNYATVRGEVDWILAKAPDAIVILHDVLWPCGRRDQYYNADAIEAGGVHEHGDDGATVWHDDVTPAGFVGQGHFTVAVEAGGERNGVLTAVEDSLAAQAPGTHEFALIPAIFGLGIIYPTGDADQTDRLRTALEPYRDSPLLAAMENNRIALYTRVLTMQYEMAAAAVNRDELVHQLDRQRDGHHREIAELERRHHNEMAALRANPPISIRNVTRRAARKAVRGVRGVSRGRSAR
ncbi:class I SAM-dependent methyltransferase [Nocardia sp. 348MFTsu5.1]|uniref:class I SAM-dependent methyltransferase n=1 Tax=Nocardia sp. 348MFTsu5.1 TaxID=1172185 RepID=UPI00036F98A9|nr:class I SAM-dependent methyltransferase [Nocardia sp. 348MFTsu5.1]